MSRVALFNPSTPRGSAYAPAPSAGAATPEAHSRPGSLLTQSANATHLHGPASLCNHFAFRHAKVAQAMRYTHYAKLTSFASPRCSRTYVIGFIS